MKRRLSVIVWRASPAMLGVAAIATAASALLLLTRGLAQNYSIESMVARDDATYRQYREFLAEFISNEIGIIVVRSAEPLAPDMLNLLHELTAECAEIKEVQRVTAVSEVPDLRRVAASGGLLDRAAGILGQITGGRTVREAVLAAPQDRHQVLAALVNEPLVVDNLVSRDGRTAAVVCQIHQPDPRIGNRNAVVRMREIVAEARRDHPKLEILLAGPAVTMIDLFDYIRRDLKLFSFVVIALMAASLWIIFRSAGMAGVAMAVAGSATLTTLGVSILADIAMSLVTQVIVILSSILAVANMVHVMVAWQEIRGRLGPGRRRWTGLLTLRRMLGPTSAAALTTVAGFGALGVSDLVPFRDFAFLMSFAILFGWVVGISAIRVLDIASLPRREPAIAGPGPLGRMLARAGDAAARHGVIVVVAFAAVLVISAAGIVRLRYESDFLQNFRPGSEIRRSYAVIESELAPVGSIDVVVGRRDGASVVSVDVLERSRRFAGAVVAELEPVKKAMSPADLLTAGGQPLPTSELALGMRMAVAETLFGADAIRNFINADRTKVRINLRAREGVQVADKLEMSRRIGELAAETFGDAYRVELTGLYPFYATLVAGLLRDQNVSFAVAVVLIFACMAFFFRSPLIALIALVPNLVPIALTMGLMGWRGISVNMATAMILAVSIGIAVDDALHYTWRFQRERRRRRAALDALKTAHATTGRACVFTSVVIVCGFWILCLSEFLPTAYFGGLIGITMLGALLADLILFPTLLIRVAGRGIGRD